MSTQYVYLEGKANWVKLYPGQEDTKYGKKASLDLYLTPESLTTFKTSGSRTKLRESEEGVFVKLTRDVDAEMPLRKGQTTPDLSGHPKVFGPDQSTPFTAPIGNGSKVIAKIAVYDSKFGKGTRLEAVTVVDHVAYEGSESNPLYKF